MSRPRKDRVCARCRRGEREVNGLHEIRNNKERKTELLCEECCVELFEDDDRRDFEAAHPKE